LNIPTSKQAKIQKTKNKKTQIKNLKMKNFLSKKTDKDNMHFFKRAPNLNLKAKRKRILQNPLEKLKGLRSSRMIESDLFKKIEQKKHAIEMTKSTRMINFSSNMTSQKKISTSRRASKLGRNDPKTYTINRSIKMLSQKYISKKNNLGDSKRLGFNYSRKKMTSIESQSNRKILSSKNIASIELIENASKTSLSRVVSKDFNNTYQGEIEKIEEVESVEENQVNDNLEETESNQSHKIGKSEDSKDGSIGSTHKSFKKEIRKKLQAKLDDFKEKMGDLQADIPQKFKYWKKNHLAGIYNFKTNINFYEIEKRIGKGSFGKVYLAHQILTGCKVALKVISKKSLKKKNAEQRIQKEINILKQIPPHPNIIRLFEIFQDTDYYYLVFEYAPLGDLVSYFFKEDLFPEEKLRDFYGKFLRGLEHIHKANIIHRDIKPDNILMDANFNPKIADFGISNFYNKDEIIEDTGGTPLYLSPEVIENEGKINFKTDIWSSGIVLYLLVFGDTPFKGRNMNELFLQILSKEVNFNHTNDFNDDQSLVQDLIKKMLTKNPENRITLDQIKKHEWLSNNLNNKKKTYLSNSEHDEDEIDLYAMKNSKEFYLNSETQPKDNRMINSCRNIGNYSWAVPLETKPGPDSIKEPLNDLYKMGNQTSSPQSKKFVTNTSTHNTNQNSPMSNVDGTKITGGFSGEKFREMMVREVIIEHLKQVGFPEEYISQSINPDNKIFNHVRGCFENLIMIL
jgi:serine/threonine protein kinase